MINNNQKKNESIKLYFFQLIKFLFFVFLKNKNILYKDN
jgi:hypothetical protein